MSRVLVTGATGFVGRHALAALAEAGHDVHAIARTRGEQMDRVTWHEADLLSDSQPVREVEPEVLLHLAWYAEHGKFWSSPENVRWVEASLALLRAFSDVGGQRVVVSGSCAEYEWSRALYPEDAPLRPATLYGAAKHGLHEVASAFSQRAGIELAWGRLFFLYGPFEAPSRFVPSIVLALLRGEPAAMTEGTQLRDFLHASDAGSALAALAASSLTGAVNIASGTPIALRDLAALIARELDAEQLLRIGALAMPPQEPDSLVADVGRLREELGWRPRIALPDGLHGVIDWWRANLPASPSRDR